MIMKLGILFNTKDRYELSKICLQRLIESIEKQNGVDVTILWQDSSTTIPASKYFGSYKPKNIKIVKNKIDATGPAKAIEIGMNQLIADTRYDWLGTIESDVFLNVDWLFAMAEALKKAQIAGYNPGIFTPFVLKFFVSQLNEGFSLLHSCGASASLFKPKAWQCIPTWDRVKHTPYGNITSCGFPHIYGTDPHPYDCYFTPFVMEAGYHVIGSRTTQAMNCGFPRAGNWCQEYLELEDEEVQNLPEIKIDHERWHKEVHNFEAPSTFRRLANKVLRKFGSILQRVMRLRNFKK